MPNQYGALAQPSLGYGNRSEVDLNVVNQWMRAQPWYLSLLKSFGQNPASVHLSDYQKQAVIKAAQANGVVVDEGGNGQEVDESGNFKAKSHAVRNTLLVAGIAAAALATAGAAGAFGGAAAGGGSAAGASTGAAAASAAAPTVAAGAGAATAGAGAAGVSAWLKPLLSVGVPVVGSLVGAKMANDANKDASALQAKGYADALDFAKSEYADQQRRIDDALALEKNRYAELNTKLEPWVTSGTASSDRMAQLLGLPSRPASTATAPPSRGPAVGPNVGAALPMQSKPVERDTAPPAAPAAAPPTAPAAAQMVDLIAPDGSTRSVPASQAEFYIQRGAKPAGVAA